MTLTGLWALSRLAGMKRVKWLATSFIGAFVAPFVVCGLLDIRINISPSLPIGLYGPTSAGAVQIVEFCPPEPYAGLAVHRGYRTAGSCPDRATPLLKPVAAREGDWVEVKQAGVVVNGRLLPNSAPSVADTAGRPLPVLRIDPTRVEPGRVWVLSSYSARSFDSRYFGPISLTSIRATLRPVLVWNR